MMRKRKAPREAELLSSGALVGAIQILGSSAYFLPPNRSVMTFTLLSHA